MERKNVSSAYADNVIVSGRETGSLSRVVRAHETFHIHMSAAGLRINDDESELYFPQWHNCSPDHSVTQFPQVSLGDSSSPPCSNQTGNCVPIAVYGVKVLGVLIGEPEYCAQ